MLVGKFSLFNNSRLKDLGYLIPSEGKPGDIAFLPFRRKVVEGLLIEIRTSIQVDFPLKAAIKLKRSLGEDYGRRLSSLSSFGQLSLGTVLAPLEKLQDSLHDKGKEFYNIEKKTENDFRSLSSEQKEVFNLINSREGGKFCLIASPGGGKTELLLYISYQIWKKGQSVIFLVPEISANEWVLGKAESIYGKVFETWNSSQTLSQKKKTFFRIQDSPSIIIGTRSSLFLPCFNLTTIIVDECHDSSFGQEFYPCYETVTSISSLENHFKVILATATPDEKTIWVTSAFNFEKIILGNFPKPKISVNPTDKIISKRSLVQTLRTLKLGKSSLIFLNHRGYSNRILDVENLNFLRCKLCHRFLYFHSFKSTGSCNSCNINFSPKDFKLKKDEFAYPGIGVEKVYNILSRFIPSERLHWISSDLSKRKILAVYRRLLNGEALTIVMTQIMIKGYHLKGIENLVYLDTPYSRALALSQKLTTLIQFSGRNKKKILNFDTNDALQPLLNGKHDNYLNELSYCLGRIVLKMSFERRGNITVPLDRVKTFLSRIEDDSLLQSLNYFIE